MFWADDENCQWTTMDHTDCLWESSRSSDQLQRRRGGHTWTCCSVERLLDDVWRTVRAATFATGVQSWTGTAELSDAGNETSDMAYVNCFLKEKCVTVAYIIYFHHHVRTCVTNYDIHVFSNLSLQSKPVCLSSMIQIITSLLISLACFWCFCILMFLCFTFLYCVSFSIQLHSCRTNNIKLSCPLIVEMSQQIWNWGGHRVHCSPALEAGLRFLNCNKASESLSHRFKMHWASSAKMPITLMLHLSELQPRFKSVQQCVRKGPRCMFLGNPQLIIWYDEI